MNEFETIVQFLIVSLLAGIIDTAGMTIFMELITRSKLANADMVRAIGSLFTKSVENSPRVGIILHFISGITFAMIYNLALKFVGVEGLWSTVGASTFFGVAHGFVLSFVLVVSVAEHHPLPQFQKAGLLVAIAHLIGHIIYGFLVGLIIGFSY